ncbi:hypothetical protein I4U23_013293 [Adineta vaga]|nr:hypothetical protein I4U23_013293 [Adineta vaga]
MAANFTALVENVITCPICLKHFDEPRMLPCKHTFCLQCIQHMTSQNNGLLECPKKDGTTVEGHNINTLPSNQTVRDLIQLFDHPEPASIQCQRCETSEAEHWCDSDCKHCFCSKCWDAIHDVGQYRNHTKLPVKDKPVEVPRCQDHGDDGLKYWCEQCTKEICGGCQQLQHRDHRFVLVTGYVKTLEEQCENNLQGVQSCLSYRSKRVDKMILEVEKESQSNQVKVSETMQNLRQLINEQERVLLENIRQDEKTQRTSIEEYKRLLQGEQHGLIEQVLNFVVVAKDKQPKKLLDARQPFENYIKRTNEKLLELKPLSRIKKHIVGFDKLNELEMQIRNMKLENTAEYTNQQLQQKIANSPDRSTLNLSSSALTDLDMEIVAKEIEINRTLRTLQLYANQISDIGARHLADALRTNKTLTDIQLYNNKVGTDGLEHFADALRTNKNGIKDEVAQCIADGLKVNKEMENQIRNINDIPAPKYENQQLQQRITANRNRTILTLSSSQLTDQDMEIVAAELKTNTTLTRLDIYTNQIGDIGAQHLADALKVNKVLKELQLFNNKIGDTGAQHLGDALKINQTLSILNLNQNQIGDNGAQYLSDALKINQTLTLLYLDQNQIGDIGAQQLAEALKTNKTLTQLWLRENRITDTGTQHLADALKTNTVIQFDS